MSEINKSFTNNSGFTMIELLVAMAVASIMMAVIGGAYWAQARTTRGQQLVVEMQQNMRTAMFFLQRDLMMAGYDADPNDGIDSTILLAQFDGNDNPEIQFTVYADDDGIDNDGDGTVDNNGELRIIHYRLFDSSADPDTLLDDLQRQANGPAIAGNIEALELLYILEDGTRVLEPADPTLIRGVGISMLARTEAESPGVRDTQIYTSLSGGIIGPFNDSFNRQLITATIKCRNMVN